MKLRYPRCDTPPADAEQIPSGQLVLWGVRIEKQEDAQARARADKTDKTDKSDKTDKVERAERDGAADTHATAATVSAAGGEPAHDADNEHEQENDSDGEQVTGRKRGV